eukprot:1319866-Rhodomonas_salina.1
MRPPNKVFSELATQTHRAPLQVTQMPLKVHHVHLQLLPPVTVRRVSALLRNDQTHHLANHLHKLLHPDLLHLSTCKHSSGLHAGDHWVRSPLPFVDRPQARCRVVGEVWVKEELHAAQESKELVDRHAARPPLVPPSADSGESLEAVSQPESMEANAELQLPSPHFHLASTATGHAAVLGCRPRDDCALD